MGQGKDEIDATPAQIRKAIARARSDLAAHLGAVNPLHLIGLGESPGESKMPTVKKPASSKGPKTSTKKAERKADPKKPDSKAKPAEGASQKAGLKRSDSRAKPTKAGSGHESKSRARKRPARSEGVVAKAGAALDTMAAGAVVGAVKAAARALDDENKAKALKGRKSKSSSTSAVLGELAPDAALGAVAGAAQTMLPEEPEAAPKNRRRAKS